LGPGLPRLHKAREWQRPPRGRSCVEATDHEKGRTTKITPDDAERDLLVNEAWSQGKDTAFEYDPDGNVRLRQTDGSWGGGTFAEGDELSGAKTARFEIDRLGREYASEVDPREGRTRVTATDYFPSGERSRRTRNTLGDSEAAVTESTYHYSDASLARMVRKRRGGEELKDRTYHYDRNGNRTSDERGSYAYNARDEVTKWTRGGSSQGSGSVDYALNGSSSITSKSDSASGESTTYEYDGDRLDKATTQGGASPGTQTYGYDQFGSTTQISGGAGAGGSGGGTGMDYDEFGRMKKGTGPDGKALTYTYDALDRRDTKQESAKATEDMAYVGTSEALSQEGDPAQGSERKSYDYTSDMERLGQAKGSVAYKGYAKEANGSVEGLEEDDAGITRLGPHWAGSGSRLAVFAGGCAGPRPRRSRRTVYLSGAALPGHQSLPDSAASETKSGYLRLRSSTPLTVLDLAALSYAAVRLRFAARFLLVRRRSRSDLRREFAARTVTSAGQGGRRAERGSPWPGGGRAGQGKRSGANLLQDILSLPGRLFGGVAPIYDVRAGR